MNKQIQYKTSESKSDWFNNHVLTKEQLAQLIREKFERAKIYQEASNKVYQLTRTR